ncbi:WD40/YVTN/BNR-like repeat-containing protein [Paenibacillus pini]|uniref:Photosynthesis system II assembly factor Ycf48/Hcf136-like domain-containing protein n=1 Tax=Paenibacillus pini JCM 16418 TaxID=1236976 RepID=W7YZH6_9BACL|nr:YCF48-related protein [Paenibacillus pini]GAF07779.1 hypothetical protein JCM16418_1807 [Paenibacillus pini JCM 16418]
MNLLTRYRFLTLAVIVLSATMLLSGCNSETKQTTRIETNKTHHVSRLLQTDLIAANGNGADTDLSITVGPRIVIKQELGRISIPYMDFVTEQTGWAVKSGVDHKLTLLQTKDGGSHWAEKQLPGWRVQGLKFISQTTGWVLVDDDCKSNNKGTVICAKEKLLHTKDAGKTWITQWENAASNVSNQDWNTKTIQFPDQNHGFVFVHKQMLLTNDGGQHWKKVNFDNTQFKPSHMSFPQSNTGYVTGVTEGSHPKLLVFKTTDRGVHWKKQFVLSESGEVWSSLGIDFSDVNTGWLLTNQEGMLSGDLYLTTDGGKHWSKQSKQRTGRPRPTSLDLIDANRGFISLDPGAGPIEGGIWSTNDGGKSLNNIAENKGWGIHELQAFNKDSIWAAGNGFNSSDYLMHSADGGKTWGQSYPPLHPVNHIIMSDKLHGYGIGIQSSQQQLLQTNDGGKTWSALTSLNGYSQLHNISFIDPNHGWMIVTKQGPTHHLTQNLVTSDGGRTWTPVSTDMDQGMSSGFNSMYLNFLDHNNGVSAEFQGSGLRIIQTKDGGISWQESFKDPKLTSIQGFTMLSLTEGWYTTYGSERKKEQINIFHMKDGKHWNKVGSIPGYDWNTKALSFPDTKHGWLLLARWVAGVDTLGSEQYRLLSTKDGGKTWISQDFTESLYLENNVQMTFTDDMNGFLTSPASMLQTEDGGLIWTVLQ